jgi:cell division protein FtsB
VTDPSVGTWRAALGQSTSAQLRQTQRDLAASQADLTAMQAERDALAVLNAKLKAEATEMRGQAEHWLTKLRETAYDLAKANHRNRILTAENEAALRALNEKERHD